MMACLLGSLLMGLLFSFLTVTLFFVALWAIFQFVFPYHLAFKERYVLFLSDASWLATYFTKAAPFSFLLGDWLTQFFRLPGAAAAPIHCPPPARQMFSIVRFFIFDTSSC